MATKKEVPTDPMEELRKKAETLREEIRETPGFEKNMNLMYAHREASNLLTWLTR